MKIQPLNRYFLYASTDVVTISKEMFKTYVTYIGGHRHRPLCLRYPTSEIDISYSDIGTKNAGLKTFIPISGGIRYRHQLSFRYQTKSISDIPISKIDLSFPNDPSKIIMTFNFPHLFQTHSLHVQYLASYHSATRICTYPCRISDFGQKFIPISDIMTDSALFSPISDVPLSGSVRYRWSRISDWVPTYGYIA